MSACVGASASECEVAEPQLESPAEYLLKMANSLTDIRIQLNDFESVRAKKGDATDLMVAIKELKNAYNCSAQMIGSYKKSKTKNIAESADVVSKGYQSLATGMDSMLADVKELLNGKETPAGDEADKTSDRMIDVKKTWELVNAGIAQGAASAIDMSDPKSKNIEKLLISKSDRDKIVSELKSQFRFPIKGDRFPIDAAAIAFYSFLTDKWKFSKTKQGN